ncbi:hypothetical protein ZHAS_00004179 [Anopheles sinensis]|uniref:Uncharacterized protein n=1 Tax=Anopheles sinensis TaxID=74873 RepID=A0A084VGB0_ANOSI|nr:hypothetical protein ZHAS_00004179 [Anopheles sinensis]
MAVSNVVPANRNRSGFTTQHVVIASILPLFGLRSPCPSWMVIKRLSADVRHGGMMRI